ncbi:serine protease [Priestia megaterium]|uniref:serine protease n=1 Tax=Priestia megaterium TaxID=1404 RepID=UPI0015CFEC54|nr:serine protease [Priestia megaterium]
MVEEYVCRIECGNSKGTGFLVQKNKILTAFHVISKCKDDSGNITITFPYNESLKNIGLTKVIDYDETLDIALLEVETKLEENQHLRLDISKTAKNENWETFGFPKSKWTAGARLTGLVSRSNIDNEDLIWDMDLTYHQELVFQGFSGSPVKVGNLIKGIILRELDGSLAAISILKIKGFLDKNKIVYENYYREDNSLNISEKDKEYQANKPVLAELENKFINLEKGYLLLKGNPGSGKSTLVMNYNSKNQRIKILGKYLVRDKNASLPVSFRTSELAFAEWLENSLWKELHLTVPPREDRKLHEWILHIQQLLNLVSEKLVAKKTKGILFIDGIEDIHSLGKIQDFFSILPEGLPNNILTVLSCQNEEILPNPIKSRIHEENIIKVVPLDIKQVRYIVNGTLQEQDLSLTIKESIMEKSEGHPLYLRYLLESCIALKDEDTIDKWLNKIPQINGDIRIYYENIWQELKDKHNELYILATISRLRESVDESILKKVLPPQIRTMLTFYLPNIKHLLYVDKGISIYHSSFNKFIMEKSSTMSPDIHYQISMFCKETDSHPYSVKNILFHLLQQEDSLKSEAIVYCNQDWADKCSTYYIEPDLIVSDLREVLTFALNVNTDVKEIARLLLLSQRIGFRYNNLFAMYASQFAKLLIQNKQFNEAVNFIIRQELLIIDDSEAIDFLIQFSKNNALEEAKEIFKILKHRFILSLELGEINHKVICSYYQALAIITSYQSDDFERQFNHEYKFLILQLEKVPDEHKEYYMDLCLYIVSYQRAFLIFNWDVYKALECYKNEGLPLDGTMLHILSNTLALLMDLQEQYDKKELSTSKARLIEDIKYLLESLNIETYDCESILSGLTDNKFDIDLINKLIIKVKNETSINFNLRENNGVDLNHNLVYQYVRHYKYKGFNDQELKYPEVVTRTPNTWEEFLASVIRLVSYINGRAWKMRCLNSEESSFEKLADMLKNTILPSIGFTLKERATWERSYFLIEDAMICIYNEISHFYKEYCPSKIDDFLNFLMNNLDYQLGMYTEGFRDVLFSVINTFKNEKIIKKSIYKLSKGLEQHILLGVQNRWERTKDLIDLTNIYSCLENTSATQRIFQELLNTSMGPSWYKEYQLSLIGSSLINLQQSSDIKNYLPSIASMLEHASGEMTFQRYIREEKEEFIGILFKTGEAENAIKFLKEQILPSPKVIKEKTESPQIDYIDTGKGYKFGVGNLDQQNLILQILSNIKEINPLLKWGFCELFLIGDLRYINSFSAMIADVLCKTSTSDDRMMLMNRLLKIFISDMTEDERASFLETLKTMLPSEIYNELEALLEKSKVKISVPNTTDTLYTTTQQPDQSKEEKEESDHNFVLRGTFGEMSAIEEANEIFLEATEEIQMDDYIMARKKFSDGLKKLQEGGWDIWTRSINSETDQAFQTLTEVCSVKELLENIKDLILKEEHTQDWIIVQKILSLVGNKLGEEEAQEILKVIIEHLNFIVQPPDNLKKYYSWLSNEKKSSNINIELTKLYIWFLGSPLSHIRYRGAEILKSLAKVNPNFFLPIIIDCSLDLNNDTTSEICAGIIYSLALEDINSVWMYINQDYIIQKINANKHFTIKYIFTRILELGEVDPDRSMGRSNEIIEGAVKGGNRDFWKYLHPMFDRLESIGLWRKDHYRRMEEYILESNAPLNIKDLMQVDEYLTLAYRKQGQSIILEPEIYKAINRTLVEEIYNTQAPELFSILSRVNPIFPSGDIRLVSKDSKEKELLEFISRKANYDKFLYEEKHEHIYYTEIMYSEQEKCMKCIEIIAFLRNRETTLKTIIEDNFSLQDIALEFEANTIQSYTEFNFNDFSTHRPLISKVNLNDFYYGGIFTPPYILNGLNINEKDIIKESWIEGRSWAFGKVGMPLREGSLMLLSTKEIDLIRNKGWNLIWYVNYNDENSFFIDRESKEVFQLL